MRVCSVSDDQPHLSASFGHGVSACGRQMRLIVRSNTYTLICRPRLCGSGRRREGWGIQGWEAVAGEGKVGDMGLGAVLGREEGDMGLGT